jgi:dTDP-4-amino-4,6-dideoxygalactose transaminase
MIPYAKHEINDDDINLVVEALKSGQLSNGRYIDSFESEFRDYTGSPYALAVSSGTAGLHLAVAAMEVPKDKTVLVPSLTFAATANSVLYCGAHIEFVDILF